MSESAPEIIPSPVARTPEEMTLEMLLNGVQLANLAKPVKVPEGVYRPRDRGPGTEERPISTQMMRFRISSRAVDGQWYNFLTEVGWKGLWVPKELIPPDVLLDNFYVNHAMMYKPEDLYSEYRIREKAKEIVLAAEGMHGTYIEEKIKMRRFTIESPMQKMCYHFYTTSDWKGLKAPRRIIPGKNKGVSSLKFLDVYLPHELEGKSKIRKAAMELIKAYENTMSTPRADRPGYKNFSICLAQEFLAKWMAIRTYLSYVDLDDGPSATVKWLIDQVLPTIPPKDQWDEVRKEVHARQKAERKRKA